MSEVLEGKKFWKIGNHAHLWVVDAVEPATASRPAFAIPVSEDGLNSEDVDLSHLLNRALYTPAD